MTIITVSSKDFAADPGKFLAQAHQAKVLITHHGRFLELSRMAPDKEAAMIRDGIQLLYEAGEIPTDGPGVPVEELVEELQMEELRGRAT